MSSNKKMNLEPFDIDRFIAVLKRNRKARKAPIITFISKRGATPFEILVSTILSLRTKDEVTAAAAERLFEFARTPEEILRLDEKKLKELIYPVGFYPTKAKRILEISRMILEDYKNIVPDRIEELLKLPGVGRKTANLVLIEGYGKNVICVDTHVHRVSNRVGYVQTKTPEETEFALEEKLPKKYWRKYNELLVAFGQTVCTPISPFCAGCAASSMCPKIGVKKSR
ncbi:MAG TPA: endonuclease III [Desulfobacterales bacterium]|nr:endonuclease III [Desulfobacterales bacterium]